MHILIFTGGYQIPKYGKFLVHLGPTSSLYHAMSGFPCHLLTSRTRRAWLLSTCYARLSTDTPPPREFEWQRLGSGWVSSLLLLSRLHLYDLAGARRRWGQREIRLLRSWSNGLRSSCACVVICWSHSRWRQRPRHRLDRVGSLIFPKDV